MPTAPPSDLAPGGLAGSQARGRFWGLGFCIALLVFNLLWMIASLQEPLVWKKDLLQDWLQAKAVVAGLSAYTELPRLAERFAGPGHFSAFPTATPHTPFSILVVLPLAYVSFPTAARIWMMVELVAWFLALWLLWNSLRDPNDRSFSAFLGFAILSLAWFPVMWEMVLGQLAILLTLLLVIAFLRLRGGQAVWGGMALGAAIALKLTGWPIILWLVGERRWSAALAALASAIGFNLLALTWISLADLVNYYLEVGPLASRLYGWNALNISVFGLTGMMFRGCATRAIQGLAVAPLVEAPGLVIPVGALGLLGLCSLAWWGLRRAELAGECRFDVGFAVFTCLSIVSNPVAWAFSLPLALVPLGVWWRFLVDAPAALPRWGAVIIGVCLLFPQIFIEKILGYVFAPAPVPFLVGCLLLAPLAGVIGLGGLLIRQGKLYQSCRVPSPGEAEAMHPA